LSMQLNGKEKSVKARTQTILGKTKTRRRNFLLILKI